MTADKDALTLEKLKISERLIEVEKSTSRIESRLFENGILQRIDNLIDKFDEHILMDMQEYSKIRSLQASQKIIMALFSVITGGLLWKILI